MLVARGIDIQMDHHQLIFVAREFADLQRTGVRGGFPIHVARAFERLIRADAVEIVTLAAAPGFQIARDVVEQRFKARARIEARIDHDCRGAW